ncbi:uncharacterized protein LOC129598983 isoform X2 [Paramacrobiotus metropolitanus]|uniref:uncharacterized protein LOC129598983 isoform X2 n=1 Tax=Paramacrobiotus metropolitanus TaxID=2943436 RepID=UPI002445F64A|nr:uncharacterized protein LOC129598983 isoform X2 [Paramacrobiotus metropolitanus]
MRSAVAMQCGGDAAGTAFSCPNFASTLVQTVSGGSGDLSYCCKSAARGPYCCDWKDYGAYLVGLDPHGLALPVGAIIGIVVGAVVLMVLFCVCCCFCCGLCCFRGRKRTITQHHTVAFAPRQPMTTTVVAASPPPYNPHFAPQSKM